MACEVSFTAELWEVDGPGGWHFVTLPLDAADAIREDAPPRAGFGSVRVTATVGGTTWQTSLFPERGTASFVLPVKKAVRLANDLLAGDAVEVALVAG